MIPRYQVTLTISGSFHYTRCRPYVRPAHCPCTRCSWSETRTVAFFLTGSIKSQQAVSDHVEYLRIFLRCWLFELLGTFQVTVLRKTVTCSADPRAKSQHRQISTHRIRQNVGFLPGDFQKSQHRTHMNRLASCKPPLPTAKKQHIPET